MHAVYLITVMSLWLRFSCVEYAFIANLPSDSLSSLLFLVDLFSVWIYLTSLFSVAVSFSIYVNCIIFPVEWECDVRASLSISEIKNFAFYKFSFLNAFFILSPGNGRKEDISIRQSKYKFAISFVLILNHAKEI